MQLILSFGILGSMDRCDRVPAILKSRGNNDQFDACSQHQG